MQSRLAVSVAAVMLLGACAADERLPDEGTLAAEAQADHRECGELGFVDETENMALCRLILQTNRRLDRMNLRISAIEGRSRFSRPSRLSCGGCD